MQELKLVGRSETLCKSGKYTILFYDRSAFYITKTNQVDKFVDIIKLADGKIESKHYENCLGIELPKQFCLIKEKGKLVVDNNLKSIREEPICKL